MVGGQILVLLQTCHRGEGVVEGFGHLERRPRGVGRAPHGVAAHHLLVAHSGAPNAFGGVRPAGKRRIVREDLVEKTRINVTIIK